MNGRRRRRTKKQDSEQLITTTNNKQQKTTTSNNTRNMIEGNNLFQNNKLTNRLLFKRVDQIADFAHTGQSKVRATTFVHSHQRKIEIEKKQCLKQSHLNKSNKISSGLFTK
jgi:hypothetical protein